MGCAQAKCADFSPRQGLEKLKRENGYVGAQRIPPAARYSGTLFRHQSEILENQNLGLINVESCEIEKVKEKSPNRIFSKRNVCEEIAAGDDLVNGWPKWLTDNIPGEVLAGLARKCADSYDKLAKIGQGTYSNVYKARDRDTGKIVALKKVRFDTSEPESVKFMAREIMILQKLNHPNIIKLEGLATSRMQYSLYLVFDFMQSDLTKIISRPGERLTEPQIKCYMQQLLLGLQHCHESGILHRDIKASNLLIDRSGVLKIADFGLANFFIPKEKPDLTSRVVTLWYRAPELLLGSTNYGAGIDLWSAGCLLAEMFVGRPIMPGRTEVEQLHRIFKLCGSPSEEYWKKMKLPASFRPPQHYKPSYAEAFREFPGSSYGILTTLLALDPAFRGTAASALQSEFFCSSPLACEISDLPVIYQQEDDSTQIKERKKHRRSKRKTSSRRKCDCKRKEVVAERETGETEASKQEKQKTSNSMSSQSSSFIPFKYVENRDSSSASLKHSTPERSTEGHLNATKNIQNFILFQASIADIVNFNHSNTQHRRSVSTLDLRTLDFHYQELIGLDGDVTIKGNLHNQRPLSKFDLQTPVPQYDDLIGIDGNGI